MNKALLHKLTGDKDTERRGKYLKKLFGQNVLGHEKTLLHRENGAKDAFMFQSVIEELDQGAAARAPAATVIELSPAIEGVIGRSLRHSKAEPHVASLANYGAKDGQLKTAYDAHGRLILQKPANSKEKLARALREQVMDSREILRRQGERHQHHGESAPWMLDSFEQDTITSAYVTADEPKRARNQSMTHKPRMNNKHPLSKEAVVARLPAPHQRRLLNASQRKQLKQIQLKEAQLTDYQQSYLHENLPQLHGSVTRNGYGSYNKTAVGFQVAGTGLDALQGKPYKSTNTNQTPKRAGNTRNVPIETRNSNSHFQSGDSASLSQRSNEYLQKVGDFNNIKNSATTTPEGQDKRRPYQYITSKMNTKGQQTFQGSGNPTPGVFEMQPLYNDTGAGLANPGTDAGESEGNKVGDSLDFTLTKFNNNNRQRSPFSKGQLQQSVQLPKGPLQSLHLALDSQITPDQLSRQGMNISVDFSNLAAGKNYMRLTTSANRRYQTSDKFYKYHKIRGSLPPKIGDQNMLFGPPPAEVIKSPAEEAAQKEKAVRRIDYYGNIINDNRNESLPNISDTNPKKAGHLTQKEAHHDKLKFFSKYPGAADRAGKRAAQVAQSSYITASSHYKYNRIREGGWGKAPLLATPNNTQQSTATNKKQRIQTQTDINTLIKPQTALESQEITGEMRTSTNANTQNSQLQDQFHEMLQTRRSSANTEQRARRADELAPRRTGRYLYQQVHLAEGTALGNANQSIFESRDSGDLQTAKIAQNTMLQDSINQPATNEYSLKVGLKIYRNVARASCSRTSRERLQDDEGAATDPDMVQVIGPNAGVPAGCPGAGVKAMNQYSSNSKPPEAELLTLTLASSIQRKNAAASQLERLSKRSQITKAESTNKGSYEVQTAAIASERQQADGNAAFSESDPRMAAVKQTQAQPQTHLQPSPQRTPSNKASPSQNRDVLDLLNNVQVIPGGRTRREQLKSTNEDHRGSTMRQTYNNYDVGALHTSEKRGIYHRNQRNHLLPSQSTSYSRRNQTGAHFFSQESSRQQKGSDRQLQNQIERQEKQSIFDKLTANDANKLISSYAFQEQQWGKKQNRKQREGLERQIKDIQQKLKDQRKLLQKQRQANTEQRGALDHQFELFQRLNHLEVTNTLNLLANQTINESTGEHPGRMNIKVNQSIAQDSELHYPLYNQSLHNDFMKSSITNDHHSVQAADPSMFDGYSSQIIQQYKNTSLDAPQYPQNMQTQPDFESPQSLANSRAAPQHVTVPPALDLSALAPPRPAPNVPADIRGMYKMLFENDLQSAKQRTLEQLETVREQNHFNVRESEVLKLENAQLKRHITRYQRMMLELKGQGEKEIDPSEFRAQKNKEKLQDNVNMDQINMQVYKYQPDREGKGTQSAQSSKTNQRPSVTQTRGATAISFGVGRQHQTMDIRKAEQISLHMPSIFKQTTALDSLLVQLQMIKSVFKGALVTLYVIEQDYQEKIFNFAKGRKHNYKKMQIGSALIYAVFTSDHDCQAPLFRELSDAHLIFNSKHILIPIQEHGQKTPCICLQIVQGSKGGAHTDKMGKKSLKKQKAQAPSMRRSASPGGKTSSPNNTTSRASLSTSNRLGAMGNRPLGHGWQQNDLSLSKILTNFMHMNIHFYVLQVMKTQKKRKILEVIEAATELMNAKTYRQIVEATKRHMTSLVGFQASTVFFSDQVGPNLFTVAVTQNADAKARKSEEGILGFAKDLYLSEDQVVMFPSSMGITGEVHNKKSIKIENAFGQLINNQKAKTLDDELDINSERSFGSIGPASRRTSLGVAHRKQSLGLTPLMKISNPQAENELPSTLHLRPRRPLTKKVSHDDIGGQGKIIMEDRTEESSAAEQSKNLVGATPVVQSKTDIQFTMPPPSQFQPNQFQKHQKKATQDQTKPSAHGSILDLAPRRAREPGNTTAITQSDGNDPEGIQAGFTPDVDNFEGTKNIMNYCLVSLKDDSYGLGETSCGVLQLFNKLNGKKIDKEDLARIKQIAKFLGALSAKATLIKNTLTVVLGLVKDIDMAVEQSSTVYRLFGIAPVESCTAPMCSEFEDAVEIMRNQMENGEAAVDQETKD